LLEKKAQSKKAQPEYSANIWTGQPCEFANPNADCQLGGQECIAETDSYFLSANYNGDVDELALASLNQTSPYSAFEAGGYGGAGGVYPDEELATSEAQNPHNCIYFPPFALSLEGSPNTLTSSVQSRGGSTQHELSRYQTPTTPGASPLTTDVTSNIEDDQPQQQQPQQYIHQAAYDYLDSATTTTTTTPTPLTARGCTGSLSYSSSPPSSSPIAPPLLHVAARARNRRIMTTLLNHGVSPNERDGLGRTALHVAAAIGDEALVALLLACGTDPGICDVHGQTALYAAVEGGYGEVVEMLLGGGYRGSG
jgi:hypothetical protein